MAMPELREVDKGALLGTPELRAGLVRFVRGRVPDAEVEDVVQATLADALASERAPSDAEELRRWVYGIAKNKIVDVHRKGSREITREAPMDEEVSAESAPASARDLLHWAEKQLPDNEGAKSTLEWMLREGTGEKLEHIAEEEKLPPDRVRQRVSRLRRHFKQRWAVELAAVAALVVLVLAVWAIWKGRATPGPNDIAHEVVPEPKPEDRAQELRRLALERCDAKDWSACLDGLDRAKTLDPNGDAAPRVQEARAAAGRAQAPPPEPSTTPAPTSSGPAPSPKPVPSDLKKKGASSSSDFPAPMPMPKLAPPASTEPPPQNNPGPQSEPQQKGGKTAPKTKAPSKADFTGSDMK